MSNEQILYWPTPVVTTVTTPLSGSGCAEKDGGWGESTWLPRKQQLCQKASAIAVRACKERASVVVVVMFSSEKQIQLQNVLFHKPTVLTGEPKVSPLVHWTTGIIVQLNAIFVAFCTHNHLNTVVT